ncbi:MFS transporter [Candidatus Rhabdochlamydia porcellionis]|jgi:predicted MFS family arabinose efflux permease|uniref:Major Facilitator Superfamily n=1 Tax=Candidatus Rhabdochlamydia porcellionis TaxID=225148 RepID=A0ABX8YYP9_9BACT|nr:MFS transporter [Candidatus Rhabdochlamydia porcellionis]QZA58440.1 Major Facilitator Superfamily [Candidatus Rhabdochlamydia porcellionis]
MNAVPSNSRPIAWAVWIIASIFYAYQYILRVMPNIMLSDIMQQFDIGAATFGQFSGVYYIGYSFMHLPIGIMLDHYGPKKMMTACILCTLVGLLPLIFSEHWVYPIAGRFLIGVGSSAAILGVFKIIRMTFNEKLFPRMLSLSVTIGLIGAIYGGGPMSYMREVFGYQTVIQLFAVLGLLLAIITYWIVPDMKNRSQKTMFSDIKEVLSNKRVIWSCVFAGMMVGPLEGFADVWGTVFLKQAYGFDGRVAASIPSMIFMGMCFGAPVLSLIAERIGNLTTIIGSGVIMAVCFFLMLFWYLGPGILAVGFVLVGMCCAYQILAIYKASTYVREQVAGLTTAVANMIIMIFGYAFHASIGGIVNFMGGPDFSHALVYGVAVIPIALCLGVGGFILLLCSPGEKVQIQESQKSL